MSTFCACMAELRADHTLQVRTTKRPCSAVKTRIDTPLRRSSLAIFFHWAVPCPSCREATPNLLLRAHTYVILHERMYTSRECRGCRHQRAMARPAAASSSALAGRTSYHHARRVRPHSPRAALVVATIYTNANHNDVRQSWLRALALKHIQPN